MTTLKLHHEIFTASGETYRIAKYEYLELDIATKTGCIRNNFNAKTKSKVLQFGTYTEQIKFTQKEVNKLI